MNGWRFPRIFWVANSVELFERAAYYGMFIALSVYLTDEIGFTDVETGWIAAAFAALLYLMPTLSGALADRMGFRPSLLIAFGSLAAGYATLGLWQTKPTALAALAIIVAGGSFVKPVISGTVALCSDEKTRARALPIFYLIVNVGSFTGKTVAKPLRTGLGIETINLYSAAMALIAFAIVLLAYRSPAGSAIAGSAARSRTVGETLLGLFRVLRNPRFVSLILIVAGFWAIQGQLYASMPKYILRVVGEDAAPEWLANVNPLVVVIMVVPVTHLVRRMEPVASIQVALGLIPCSAMLMGSVWLFGGVGAGPVRLPLGIEAHPATLAACAGIALQGLAECFLSPRFLEYASRQAPEGEVGLYMGYSYLTNFFAWLAGFSASGYLLDAYCPDPSKVPQAARAQAYAHAHHIWYVFAGVGAVSFLALLVFRLVTRKKEIPDAKD